MGEREVATSNQTAVGILQYGGWCAGYGQTIRIERSRKKRAAVQVDQVSRAPGHGNIVCRKAALLNRFSFAGLERNDIDVGVVIVSSGCGVRCKKDSMASWQNLRPAVSRIARIEAGNRDRLLTGGRADARKRSGCAERNNNVAIVRPACTSAVRRVANSDDSSSMY